MDFHYKKIPIIDLNKGKVIDTVFRPVIQIAIIKEIDKKPLDYEVLIDSGADECILPLELAEIAQIDLANTETKEFRGIGGGVAIGHKKQVAILLGGYQFSTPVYFSSGIKGYGILGQRGFFEKFRIRFIYSAKKIEITAERLS